MSEEVTELNDWLAENVMGWELIPRTYRSPAWMIPDGEWPDDLQFYKWEPEIGNPRDWQPTRRIQQAMMVLDKTIANGATPYMYLSSGLWHCQLAGLGSITSESTLCLAICKAVRAGWPASWHSQ